MASLQSSSSRPFTTAAAKTVAVAGAAANPAAPIHTRIHTRTRTPAPTPILKTSSSSNSNSRKRNRHLAPSTLQFSLPPTMENPKEEEEESDTDIGSHGDDDDDVSFSFDSNGDEAGMATATAGGDGTASASAPAAASGGDNKSTSPPPSISRMGAKVRRLNLGDGDDNSTMDVKKSLAQSSKQSQSPMARADVSNNFNWGVDDSNSSPPPSSPSNERSNINTNNEQANDSNNSNMLICPPSTAKKRRGISRLFANTSNDCNEEEDVSPRDVVDFPFFDSPPSTKKKGGAKENGDDGNNMSSLPECPPSTMKKKPHRGGSGGGQYSTSLDQQSPPRGLRSLGRANSFLQMFSQDSMIMEENDDNDDDEEDFIHKPTTIGGGGHGMEGEMEYTIPSPKRPIRNHRRFTPSSPNNTIQTTLTTPSLSSSFSRFAADFEIIGAPLGAGTFGSVYKVRNRTDLRMYAIKAAKREARGPTDRNRMLQEVYALSALSDQACMMKAMHIVRYHQAWMEGNRLYIQTELCELTLMEEMRIGITAAASSAASSNTSGAIVMMGEKRRYKLLREMLLALDLVHKNGMIHLDIKPENIFIKNDQYKLGDFGLVSKIENHNDVEEGDSRYMSMELLEGDLDDLTKSDIFSLGATMYEICLGRPQPLPENGPEWQNMRQGKLLSMPNTSFDMQMIIREMMAPDRHGRPSAEELLKKRQLLSDEQRQLIVERNKANAANMALDAQM
ncbi:hypothetical protein ACHAXR_007542, partial [Thalassiosira sp. AJA248-18]